jgi:hypothetical protein
VKPLTEPSELARRLMDYLDCPCEWFPPMEDDDPILERFHAACEEGSKKGFFPVLVTADDLLLECLALNSGCEDGEEITREKLRFSRARLLQAALPDSSAFLSGLLKSRRAELEEDGILETELFGKVEGGETLDRFCSFWDYETETTHELLLARIPADHPWEVFAWLPMGGWNECPDTPGLMAAARHWYERYGAIPCAVTHDELEFRLAAPVTGVETASRLAWEQYAFCPDRVDQCEENGTIGTLADTLRQSTVWYFWWD